MTKETFQKLRDGAVTILHETDVDYAFNAGADFAYDLMQKEVEKLEDDKAKTIVGSYERHNAQAAIIEQQATIIEKLESVLAELLGLVRCDHKFSPDCSGCNADEIINKTRADIKKMRGGNDEN